MGYKFRVAKRKELDTAISWAAKEGWNPGLYDADAFWKTDPKGFFIGLLNEKPIASISAISYGKNFGFIGFYIVKPRFRKKGYGYQLWKYALKHLPTQNIGLDGVVAQQENYKKSGFKLAYGNIRYEGFGDSHDIADENIIPINKLLINKIVNFDKGIFPVKREIFLSEWFKQPQSLSLCYLKDGKILGYGMVRKCRKGFKVGPLFADDIKIAEKLFLKFRKFVGKKQLIYLDIPEVNKKGIILAKKYKMKPMFSTARMYTKGKPKINLQNIFGVTTFELG